MTHGNATFMQSWDMHRPCCTATHQGLAQWALSEALTTLCHTPLASCYSSLVMVTCPHLLLCACRLAHEGLDICLSAYLHACGSRLALDVRCQQGQTALEVAHQRGHEQCALLLQHAQHGRVQELAAGAAGTSLYPYRQQQHTADSLQERSAVGQPSGHIEGFARPSLSLLDLTQQEASFARTLKPTQVRVLLRPLLHAARCKLHFTAGHWHLQSQGGL